MLGQVNSGYFKLVHVKCVKVWLDLISSVYFILG